jgi:glycosyltransferase involved in cell wall biosynthesis
MTEVCLIVEGGYPYALGGVSEWVDRLIVGQPELDFCVAHLGDPDDPPAPPVYERPANLRRVVHIDCDPYEQRAPAVGQAVPDADVYHALSTGLAGDVAAEVAQERGRPLLLTEHGLAWREAGWAIDACKPAGCKPVGCKPVGLVPGKTPAERAERRAAWARRVRELASDTYARADAIKSVCAANARAQLQLGAPAPRLRVIPNAAPAVSAASGPPGAEGEGALTHPRVGLVGRVVPIKDVVTFLRACALLAERLPGARFEVIGPLDHDPDYAELCQALARELEIAERVEFTGPLAPERWPARLDVLVLTSRSEAAPLVVLEAMAAELPVVSTDVGGCAELVGARPGAGRQAHPAGLLTAVGSPRATAAAIERVCTDGLLRERLAASGHARALGRHSPASVMRAYRSLYEAACEGRLAA